MILALFRTRTETAAERPTPAQLAERHRHVRVTPHVITRLPRQDYKPRRCDGQTCVHEHAGVSRRPQIRLGRRWVA